MTLRFIILGFEVASIDLDIHLPEDDKGYAIRKMGVERGVKAVSKAWVKRMVS